jgi:glyoxylase-like metal-dependent hydrolase (beta-lactamase superfamily II)
VAVIRQESEPPSETLCEVAPGILRCQLPVNMPGLGHVNAYLVLDDRGATLVDAGVPGEASWSALLARLADAGLAASKVHTVVVTHSHPDHFGGAHRLAAEAGAEVVTHGAWQTRWWQVQRGVEASRGASATSDCCGAELPDIDPADIPSANPWTEPTPWGKESFMAGWLRDMPEQGSDAARWLPPEPDRGVADGETLVLAGRPWRCLYTPGHTLDHLCLYDPEAGVLLSGDHVLPTITPHIPGIAGGRDALASYLASLARVAELAAVGLVSVVLPAHGNPFSDLSGRIAGIQVHHRERLDRLCEIAGAIGPATVGAYSHELFREARWGPMAESETYAHLEHLRLTNRLIRRGTGAEMVYLSRS